MFIPPPPIPPSLPPLSLSLLFLFPAFRLRGLYFPSRWKFPFSLPQTYRAVAPPRPVPCKVPYIFARFSRKLGTLLPRPNRVRRAFCANARAACARPFITNMAESVMQEREGGTLLRVGGERRGEYIRIRRERRAAPTYNSSSSKMVPLYIFPAKCNVHIQMPLLAKEEKIGNVGSPSN